MEDKVLRELSELFRKYPDIERAALFGSRARGDNGAQSDYDVAVYGDVSPTDKTALRFSCREDVSTLYKIDLIFMNDSLEKKFIDRIHWEGIIFYGEAE